MKKSADVVPAKAADAPEVEVDQELVAASIPDETGAYWITPELAGLWLTCNENNRPIRDARVATMARDMSADNWAYTGEAIKFSAKRRLIDGQHRLSAVVRSGATVKMLVVLDLPDESQAYMDAGARRTAGDALTFRGETNSTLLAATIRFAMNFEARATRSRDAISHSEIIEWLTEHPEIRRYVGLTARYSGKIDMKPSVFAFALWKLHAIDEKDATAFLAAIVEMRSLGAGDPIYTLLQRFRTAARQRELVKPSTELAWIFRTWNAMRQRQSLKILKVPGADWEIPVPR
jgi:hypothetical protein